MPTSARRENLTSMADFFEFRYVLLPFWGIDPQNSKRVDVVIDPYE